MNCNANIPVKGVATDRLRSTFEVQVLPPHFCGFASFVMLLLECATSAETQNNGALGPSYTCLLSHPLLSQIALDCFSGV